MTPDQTTDIAYARLREAEERAAASAATNPAIRDAHFTMAERYADQAWSLEEGSEAVQ